MLVRAPEVGTSSGLNRADGRGRVRQIPTQPLPCLEYLRSIAPTCRSICLRVLVHGRDHPHPESPRPSIKGPMRLDESGSKGICPRETALFSGYARRLRVHASTSTCRLSTPSQAVLREYSRLVLHVSWFQVCRPMRIHPSCIGVCLSNRPHREVTTTPPSAWSLCRTSYPLARHSSSCVFRLPS